MALTKKIWSKWHDIAKMIGNFQAQVFLSLFYLIFLSILGIVFRFTDPLQIRSAKKRSQFSKWDHTPESLETARKQF